MQPKKGKLISWASSKFKTICCERLCQENNRNKWQTRTVINHLPDQGLAREELLNLNRKKNPSSSAGKWTKDVHRHFTRENTQNRNKLSLISRQRNADYSPTYNHTAARMPKTHISDSPQRWWRCGETELFVARGDVKRHSCSGKVLWKFLKTLNMQLLYDPAVSLLGIYPRKRKLRLTQKLYSNVYSRLTENSPELATTWISFNRWVVKLWSTHSTEHHSARHRNELLIHTIAWVDLQGMMVSETTVPKDDMLYNSIHVTYLKWQNYGNGEQNSSCQGLGRGGRKEVGVP